MDATAQEEEEVAVDPKRLKPKNPSIHRSSPSLPRRNPTRSAGEFRFLYRFTSRTFGGGDDDDNEVDEYDEGGDNLGGDSRCTA